MTDRLGYGYFKQLSCLERMPGQRHSDGAIVPPSLEGLILISLGSITKS